MRNKYRDTKIWKPKGHGLISKVVKPGPRFILGEDPSTRPWRVQLQVQQSKDNSDTKPVIYYVRGSNPQVAACMAERLWSKWEKADMNISTEYPDVREMGFAEYIDEDDFRSAWDEVRKYNLTARVAGDTTDPMAFTCIGRTDL